MAPSIVRYAGLDLNCHSVQMPAHPPLSTLADAAVASSGTCHCYPEWHSFPVYWKGCRRCHCCHYCHHYHHHLWWHPHPKFVKKHPKRQVHTCQCENPFQVTSFELWCWLWISSIASPICQEGQSERNLPIFAFSSPFFLFFSWFFSDFWQIFTVRGGTLPSLPPQWLRHCFGCPVSLKSWRELMIMCFRRSSLKPVSCASSSVRC